MKDTINRGYRMFTTLTVAGLIIILAGFVSGCGGGGSGGGGGVDIVGNSTPVIPSGNSSIAGSVSGTTIIAVDDSGNVLAMDDTDGRAPDQSGHYPFMLTGLPENINLRIYLVTEEGIFPLMLNSTNVFNLTAKMDVQLGFVNTLNGTAVAQNDITSDPGVVTGTANLDLPTSFVNPTTTGLTLSELNAGGFKALENGLVIKAREFFRKAVQVAGGRTSNEADTARFGYAMTRISALPMDIYSDGNATDMNKLSDILDRLGCDKTSTTRNNWEALDCPFTNTINVTLPSDSPTGKEIQDFLYTVLRGELVGAIGNLTDISTGFTKKWTFNGVLIDSDFGDVLFFKSMARGQLSVLNIQRAYNLEADIDAEVNAGNTAETFINTNRNFGKLAADANTYLNRAKTQFGQALSILDNAITWISNELDNQADDLVDLQSFLPQDIARMHLDIADIQSSLNGPTLVDDNDANPLDDFTLDLSRFFAGLDLRSPNMLPPITGPKFSGLFPDPTFDGIVTGKTPDLNEDVFPFPDGIPDVLQ